MQFKWIIEELKIVIKPKKMLSWKMGLKKEEKEIKEREREREWRMKKFLLK